MGQQTLWSPLNTEPWCTVFCRLFDMAPHIGTFLVLIKVSEKAKKMCLPWPRRWAGPCYRMPRYFVHETIRLFLVLFFFFQVWFQLWYAIALVLTIGYGYPEHRIKRNVIPAAMLVIGVAVYTVCWCGFFGRKQDGSHAAAQRQAPNDRARNQNDGDGILAEGVTNNNNLADGVANNNSNGRAGIVALNNNNRGDEGKRQIPKTIYQRNALNAGAIHDDYFEDETPLPCLSHELRHITSLPNMNLAPSDDAVFAAPAPVAGSSDAIHSSVADVSGAPQPACRDEFSDTE